MDDRDKISKEGEGSIPRHEEQVLKPDKPAQDQTERQEDDDVPFDFGGLPKRDLKKNLGCG